MEKFNNDQSDDLIDLILPVCLGNQYPSDIPLLLQNVDPKREKNGVVIKIIITHSPKWRESFFFLYSKTVEVSRHTKCSMVWVNHIFPQECHALISRVYIFVEHEEIYFTFSLQSCIQSTKIYHQDLTDR